MDRDIILIQEIGFKILEFKKFESKKELTNRKVNELLEYIESIMVDKRYKYSETRYERIKSKCSNLLLWFLLDEKIFKLFIENLKRQ